MRRRFLYLSAITAVLLVAVSAASGSEVIERVKQGDTAPRFALPVLGEKSDYFIMSRARETVVLNFFATWCVPCRDELPELQQLARLYEEKPVMWWLVNVGDTEDSTRAFLTELGVDMPVLMERYVDATKVSLRFCGDPLRVPTTAVISPDGVVTMIEHGYNPDASIHRIREALRELGIEAGAAEAVTD